VAREASLRLFFSNLPGLFALFAPAIAMRMWAEERRSGTVELLLTLPVTIPQAVLGKFLASWVFFGIALLLSTSMAFTVAWLGEPDIGPMFAGYFGAFLLAGAYLAIGGFFSAITKNQVIAFVLGAAVCAMFVYAGSPSVVGMLDKLWWVPRFAVSFVESISFLTHFDNFERGLIAFSDLFFVVAVAAGFLAATVFMLRETKAR
jgi:ABC-2 type transport system permease protein